MRSETRTKNEHHAAAGVIRKRSISKRRKRGNEILFSSFPRYPCHWPTCLCLHNRPWALGSIPQTGNFCTSVLQQKLDASTSTLCAVPRVQNSGFAIIRLQNGTARCNQSASMVQIFAPARPLMKMVRNGTPLPKNGTAPSRFSLLRSKISDLRSPATLSSVEESYKTVRFSPKMVRLPYMRSMPLPAQSPVRGKRNKTERLSEKRNGLHPSARYPGPAIHWNPWS
jgi:hypothetical protein